MRASGVRALVVQAIEAAVADDPRHPGDVLQHIDLGADEVGAAPDRSFSVQLAAQPQRIEASSCDLFRVEYFCQVYYSAAQPGVQDRIAGDFERLYSRLDRLHEQSEDVCRCDVLPGGIVPDAPETTLSQFSVVVVYRLDAAVVLNQ
jgi:hypothetical protein